MAWTNFTNLGTGPGTTPQLDVNLLTLSELVNIPCTSSGTNTLVLTQSVTTATIPGYLNYMNLLIVASATNTASTTANFNGFGALNIYKDLSGGPTLLSGGEIIQNCAYTLIYDSTLNSGAGGFHLRNSSSNLNGQAIVAQSITASLGTITTLNATNFNAASASIGSIGNFSGLTGSLTGLQIGGSINTLIRMQSSVVSFSIVTGNALTPGQEAGATISFSGCVVGDVILANAPTPSASLAYSGYVGASGSIIFRIHNLAPSATITVSLFTIRFTDIGFAS